VTPIQRFTCVVLLLPAGAGWAASPNAASTTPPAPSAIVLKEDLSDRNPQAFARRLGEVLGVEVRLPSRGFQKLSVPAGEWTPTRLLNSVARQIDGAGWQHVYELRTAIKGRAIVPPPQPKLVTAGKVTMSAAAATFSQVVEKVEAAAPCVIRLPDGTPPGRFRVAWKDAPLSRVLADIATAGGLRVTQAIVFQRGDEAQAEAARREEERQSRETLQQSEIADRLQQLYGADPKSEEFPWDNLDRDAVSRSLGRELDMDPVLVDTLIERIRLDALTRREE
jgi:hypothetical protein